MRASKFKVSLNLLLIIPLLCSVRADGPSHHHHHHEHDPHHEHHEPDHHGHDHQQNHHPEGHHGHELNQVPPEQKIQDRLVAPLGQDQLTNVQVEDAHAAHDEVVLGTTEAPSSLTELEAVAEDGQELGDEEAVTNSVEEEAEVENLLGLPSADEIDSEAVITVSTYEQATEPDKKTVDWHNVNERINEIPQDDPANRVDVVLPAKVIEGKKRFANDWGLRSADPVIGPNGLPDPTKTHTDEIFILVEEGSQEQKEDKERLQPLFGWEVPVGYNSYDQLSAKENSGAHSPTSHGVADYEEHGTQVISLFSQEELEAATEARSVPDHEDGGIVLVEDNAETEHDAHEVQEVVIVHSEEDPLVTSATSLVEDQPYTRVEKSAEPPKESSFNGVASSALSKTSKRVWTTELKRVDSAQKLEELTAPNPNRRELLASKDEWKKYLEPPYVPPQLARRREDFEALYNQVIRPTTERVIPAEDDFWTPVPLLLSNSLGQTLDDNTFKREVDNSGGVNNLPHGHVFPPRPNGPPSPVVQGHRHHGPPHNQAGGTPQATPVNIRARHPANHHGIVASNHPATGGRPGAHQNHQPVVSKDAKASKPHAIPRPPGPPPGFVANAPPAVPSVVTVHSNEGQQHPAAAPVSVLSPIVDTVNSVVKPILGQPLLAQQGPAEAQHRPRDARLNGGANRSHPPRPRGPPPSHSQTNGVAASVVPSWPKAKPNLHIQPIVSGGNSTEHVPPPRPAGPPPAKSRANKSPKVSGPAPSRSPFSPLDSVISEGSSQIAKFVLPGLSLPPPAPRAFIRPRIHIEVPKSNGNAGKHPPAGRRRPHVQAANGPIRRQEGSLSENASNSPSATTSSTASPITATKPSSNIILDMITFSTELVNSLINNN